MRKSRRATRGVDTWAADADTSEPSPLFSARLLGLSRRRLDLALSLGLVLLVGFSRWAAFPASIWEQDEAYFGSAVRAWDVAVNHPHPPWFPLWIVSGKLLGGLKPSDPAFGLRIASAVLGTWVLFPLTALWSQVLRRPLAVAAAALFLSTPASWLFAGRAFSETPATALLVFSLACWLRRAATPAWMGVGSIAAGAAMLIRPQLAPVLLIPAAWLLLQQRRWRPPILVPILAAGAVAGAGLILASGGIRPLIDALSQHAEYHFGALPMAAHDLASSGLARALGHPLAALAWVAAALAGSWRSFSSANARILVLGALLPATILVLALANPAHARYAVPLLALSSGLVVVGARIVLGPATPVTVAIAVIGWAAAVIPELGSYRTETSPPVAAVRAAFREAEARRAIIIADRTLVAFVDYVRASEQASTVVFWDHQIEDRSVPPPPASFAVAVFDRGHDRLYCSAQEQRIFSCGSPLLHTLSQDRFLEVTVANGVEVQGYTPGKPLILIGGEPEDAK